MRIKQIEVHLILQKNQKEIKRKIIMIMKVNQIINQKVIIIQMKKKKMKKKKMKKKKKRVNIINIQKKVTLILN